MEHGFIVLIQNTQQLPCIRNYFFLTNKGKSDPTIVSVGHVMLTCLGEFQVIIPIATRKRLGKKKNSHRSLLLRFSDKTASESVRKCCGILPLHDTQGTPYSPNTRIVRFSKFCSVDFVSETRKTP